MAEKGYDESLRKLPNIGKDTADLLARAGIDSAEKLISTGSHGAWLKIRAIDPSACLSRLCGLEGAVRGVRWHQLDADIKRELKAFYEKYK